MRAATRNRSVRRMRLAQVAAAVCGLWVHGVLGLLGIGQPEKDFGWFWVDGEVRSQDNIRGWVAQSGRAPAGCRHFGERNRRGSEVQILPRPPFYIARDRDGVRVAP